MEQTEGGASGSGIVLAATFLAAVQKAEYGKSFMRFFSLPSLLSLALAFSIACLAATEAGGVVIQFEGNRKIR